MNNWRDESGFYSLDIADSVTEFFHRGPAQALSLFLMCICCSNNGPICSMHVSCLAVNITALTTWLLSRRPCRCRWTRISSRGKETFETGAAVRNAAVIFDSKITFKKSPDLFSVKHCGSKTHSSLYLHLLVFRVMRLFLSHSQLITSAL